MCGAEVRWAPVAAPVAAAKKAVATNGTKMEAPMPGMIKSYKVAEGATVKKGDVVLVLEAMKMDNDMTAPCDGVVSFKAAVGSNVETGAVMAVIS
ncbi:MAG: acetyl-CoA carboxylase biotin carboxyl carrier protein subunit [Clostridia bacterium]|nr:acetyl-CoA carboxylase biotin carboxyl carrier protein subunit [Clostridia bacterium]